MNVFVTLYQHRHGTDVDVFRTREAAEQLRVQIAQEWFDEELPDQKKPDNPDELADVYFKKVGERMGREEWFEVRECCIQDK